MVWDSSVSVCRVSVAAFLLTTVSAGAATVTSHDTTTRRGGPIAQNFLDTHGENVSFLATSNGISCVASQPLPIADALYVSSDGTVVPFAEVTRSPASSIQAIAQPDRPVAFRIQMKYAPDPAKPIVMELDGQSLDLADALESSRDSLWLTGGTARMLAEALRRGETPALRATSDGTGRQVADQITAPDMAGLDACLVTLEDLLEVEDMPDTDMSALDISENDMPTVDVPDMDARAGEANAGDALRAVMRDTDSTITAVDGQPFRPALPVAVAGLRLEFVARPDPEARVAASALESCRMRDIPENLFLGRLTAVTGFFSQTQDVYVAFNDAGQVQRAYIPGIFDSDLTKGTNSARVSLAADANLPDQPNTVRGCLGDALLEAPVCVSSNQDGDGYTVSECGVLGMSMTREGFMDALPALTFDEPEQAGPRLTSRGAYGGTFSTNPAGSGSGGGSRGGLPGLSSLPGLGGGGSNSGDGGDGGDTGGGEVSPVPLPAALWLMLASLSGLYGFGVWRRRKVST